MEEITNDLPETLEVVDIQFRPGQKVYYFDPNGMKFVPGDPVIMDTARGPEFGTCAGANHFVRRNEIVAPLRQILRRATQQDLKIVSDIRAREKRAPVPHGAAPRNGRRALFCLRAAGKRGGHDKNRPIPCSAN